ncbi:hypothetical protein D7V86_05285 [bacterium D16-51]|nr:hypothetical protein D7V96_12530 [bacterium D16-59]RKI61475.1 hypothetical protein D7V86_05285 [bacterium D16-51]
MRKEDRLIKEAFEVYQSAGVEGLAGGKGRGEEMEYTEGFEDRIYRCIERLHITNPRQKARRLYLGILVLLVVCISGGFLAWRQLYKPVRATKQFAALFSERQKELAEAGAAPGIAYEEGSSLKYEFVYLDDDFSNRLENSGISYQKAEGGLKMQVQEYPLLREEEVRDSKEWEVYRLSDRESKYYYVLKNGDGDVALARYAGVRLEKTGEERANMERICKEVYGIASAKDIRSITLERYQGRSSAEPDKLMAVYTKEEDKEYILSFFCQDNKVHGAWESEEGLGDVSWQPIDALKKKGWKEAVEEMPEKCYLLALENRYHENFLMGIVKEEERVQVFVDMQQQRGNTKYYMSNDVVMDVGSDIDVYCVELSKEEQQEAAEWIQKADKEL